MSKLTRLSLLSDNWDGQGSPAPDKAALADALDMIAWASQRGLELSEADADVLEGVALWFRNKSEHIRIGCMNNGSRTFVIL